MLAFKKRAFFVGQQGGYLNFKNIDAAVHRLKARYLRSLLRTREDCPGAPSSSYDARGAQSGDSFGIVA
jgi:hypothetical protein